MMTNEFAVVGDLHKGIGSGRFLEEQIMFHVKHFIPYLQERGIKTIVFLGDIFDNRKQLDVFMLNRVLELFDLYESLRFDIRIIIGNHDTNLKNTNAVNSLKTLKKYSNVKIYEEITQDKIGDLECLFVPWQYDLNQYIEYVNSNILDHIQVSFGHFDIINAMMNRQTASKVGFKREDIMKFPVVYSGHYHSRSVSKMNNSTLIYTGTPYELNRGDMGEDKGFYIQKYSGNTLLESEFIPNTYSPRFIEIVYPQEVTSELVKNNIVDMVYSEKDDVDEIQKFKEKIASFEPFSTFPKMLSVAELEGVGEIKFTNVRQIFEEYIEQLTVDEEIRPQFIETIKQSFETNYSEV